jgi:hypothetical protein
VDSEGLNRTLVVDVAIDVAVVPGDEKLHVTQFVKFVSLDGVDWNDPVKKSKLYVGKAILDYTERARNYETFEPTKKENIDRVVWSAALHMADGNYIPITETLASLGSPIIVNNACASWHRLAETFTFGNARAYIGTLFSVLDSEAQAMIEKLLGPHFGKPLSVALWHAHNSIFNSNVRRPYLLVGCHFQRLRTTTSNAPLEILKKLNRAHASWQRRLRAADPTNDSLVRRMRDNVRYLKSEIDAMRERWFKADPR